MSKKRMIIVLIVGAIVLAITSCNINAIRGSGDLITESRNVGNFDSIALSGSGEVIVTQGAGESLTIETDDNVMEHVKAEVRGGTLELGFKERTGSISPTRLIFTVGVDDLKGLRISGSGDIESSTVDTDRLDVKIDGSGDINLSGEATAQEVTINGSGKHDAADLRSESVEVNISGSGEATVWATQALDTNISGSGTVNYYGTPSVNSSGSGSGQVKNRGDK